MRLFKCIIIIFVFMCLVGCDKEKSFVCNLDIYNTTQDYSLHAIYKVYYKGNYVKRIVKKDVYSSDNIEMLNYFEQYKNLEYDNLNSIYGGFDFEIKKDETNLTINTNINLNEVNVKKMLIDKYIDSNYIISNKLTISGIKYFYKEKGAVCE